MAEQEERSMIGYDPLAWLHENKSAQAVDPVTEAVDAGVWGESAQVEQDIAQAFPETELSSMDASSILPAPDEKPLPPIGAESISEADNTLEKTIGSENIAVVGGDVAYMEPSAVEVTLEASQTIQNVGDLHQQLQSLLGIASKIDIDASAVTQIDTATMQLLLVLKLTAANLQKEVNIDFPSDRFLEAAQLLGVAEMLSVDQAASGFF